MLDFLWLCLPIQNTCSNKIDVCFRVSKNKRFMFMRCYLRPQTISKMNVSRGSQYIEMQQSNEAFVATVFNSSNLSRLFLVFPLLILCNLFSGFRQLLFTRHVHNHQI